MNLPARLARSLSRAQKLAAQTRELVTRSRETIAEVRNRIHALRLMREVRAMNGSAPARAALVHRRRR
jgi:hypothetical protein